MFLAQVRCTNKRAASGLDMQDMQGMSQIKNKQY